LHAFREILVIAIAAMLSDCDTVEDMAFWARKMEAWLRRFLSLNNGIPSEDRFLRIFRALDPKHFEAAFRRWVAGVIGALGGTIAIDGKTVRGSGSGGETAIHMVSAFATELGVVLGQEKVADKSNEITAIPELLEALYIKGLLVSIDAMGCQKSIARQITEQRGDYLLMVKGNQPTLLNAIETAFIDAADAEAVDRQPTAEKSHGRIVAQIASVLSAKGVVPSADWPQCKIIGRIDSVRRVGNKESERERCYYVSSRDPSAEELAAESVAAQEDRPQSHPHRYNTTNQGQLETQAKSRCLG
jgi:predicted transposase YbfD/YdcC